MRRTCSLPLRTASTQLEDISGSVFSRDFFAPFLEDFTTTTHREAQEVASHYFNRAQEVL